MARSKPDHEMSTDFGIPKNMSIGFLKLYTRISMYVFLDEHNKIEHVF